jgi:hypothetical protein
MIEGTGTNQVPEEIAVKMSEKLTGKGPEKGWEQVRTAISAVQEPLHMQIIRRCLNCWYHYLFMNLTV